VTGVGSAGTAVDLRSDTVTRPTAGMRAAMAEAPVGDDAYGEDPTVNELERRVAELFGHEAALFVPSGTMGNQIAVQALVPRGTELICDAGAHVVTYEGGAAAAYGGVSSRTWVSGSGRVEPAAIAAQLRPAGWHTVPTAAVAVEQTHNRGGGTVQPLQALTEVRALTLAAGVALHCDGARIWNAQVASGVPLRAYGEVFDTLSVCLSKGLGAPVGSVVVGAAEPMAVARSLRHRLGGAMRQAGVLAAAGGYALDQHRPRLADDHRRARWLAGELVSYGVDPERVETNIVLMELPPTGPDCLAVVGAAAERGVLLSPFGPRTVRAVTHLDVDDAGIERAAAVIRAIMAIRT
jgi:threonine aldolase